MKKAIVQALLLGIAGGIVILPAIFLSAGTINYWQGWLYGSVVMISLTAFNVSIAIHDPEAIRRRTKIGAPHEQQIRQKLNIDNTIGYIHDSEIYQRPAHNLACSSHN